MSGEMADSSRVRFEAAIAAFDQANSADPNSQMADGVSLPRELLYARRMSDWLDRLIPDATESLRLAARCQHIERWRRPRSEYPEGRVGYLTWRRDLKKYHADRAGEILRQIGYAEETISAVQTLLRKERLKQNPDSQSLEDVVCLVFLEHYFEEFAAQHDKQKIVEILRKTWAKMSERGHAAALTLPFSPNSRALVEEALAPGGAAES